MLEQKRMTTQELVKELVRVLGIPPVPYDSEAARKLLDRERPELTPSEDARELERQLRDASDAPWETDPQDIVAILTAFKERILREAIEGMRVIYERAVAKYITGEGLDLDWHEIEAAIMGERSKAMSINETRGEPDIVMGALSPASPPESAAKGEEREWAENCGGMALPPPSEPSGWISVDDRLPDDEQTCFVRTKYGDASVAVYLVAKSGACFCPDVDALEQKVGWERDDWRSVGEVRFEGTITHWMPLPAPPDVKE